MKKLRVGVVGASFGGVIHVPAFQAQGRFDVVAIASPNRAAEVARARKIPASFASLDDMLAATQLDVLSIATPPYEHRDAVLSALERGLHVLCEKPFGLNVAQAEEMCAAAERAGTVCALAHEFRYTPARRALRELVANAHLGPLRAIEATRFDTFLGADVERPQTWWFSRRRGGGISGAILSHLIDEANWLGGRRPLRATGYERTAVGERRAHGERFTSDVADGAFATIDYGEGTIATVTADATRAVESSTIAVHGARRTAVASGDNMLAVTTFVVDAEETSELQLAPQAHANLSTAHPNLPPFVTLLDAFAAAIDDGATADVPTFADGLTTQRVLEAVGYSVTEA